MLQNLLYEAIISLGIYMKKYTFLTCLIFFVSIQSIYSAEKSFNYDSDGIIERYDIYGVKKGTSKSTPYGYRNYDVLGMPEGYVHKAINNYNVYDLDGNLEKTYRSNQDGTATVFDEDGDMVGTVRKDNNGDLVEYDFSGMPEGYFD